MAITHVTPADGNIFADLGFSRVEATNLKIRSSLMVAVQDVVDRRGLSRAEAAELFDVDQPRIDRLLRGKIDDFTIDSLVMLAHAGIRVEVRVDLTS